MKIEMFHVEQLKPYVRNNKRHGEEQIERLIKSIAQFGFNQPIVVDENCVILVGHGRYEAAKRMNLQSIPVLVKVGLSEKQKKAYRIIDNKLSDQGEYDEEALTVELMELESMDFDMASFGIDLSHGGTDDDDESGQSIKEKGVGYKIEYTMVFDDEAQQDAWFKLLKILKQRYPYLVTTGQRMEAYVTDIASKQDYESNE